MSLTSDPLASVALVSGGRPEGFTPLVVFRGTYGSGRQSGQLRQYQLLPKSQGLALSLAGVCERYGFGGQAMILPNRP